MKWNKLLRHDMRIVCEVGRGLAFTWLRGGLDFGSVLGVRFIAHGLPDFVEIGAGIYTGHYLVLSNPDGGSLL